MSRVITFSRAFPAYHPRKGESTFFVEGILKSICPDWKKIIDDQLMPDLVNDFALSECKPKKHTIRAGHRWKAGDKFSPRVWSGKPYYSPQIIIAPDMEVKKVWDFTIKKYVDDHYPDVWYIDFGRYSIPDAMPLSYSIMPMLAENDGLSLEDFEAWFKWPSAFSGQIICWDENVNY